MPVREVRVERRMARAIHEGRLTASCNCHTRYVERRKLVAEEPRRHDDGCDFLGYTRYRHGHNACPLNDTATVALTSAVQRHSKQHMNALELAQDHAESDDTRTQ